MTDSLAGIDQPSQDNLARFIAAIHAREDQATERAALTLTPQDEAALIALSRKGGEAQWWAIRALARVGSAASASTLATALHDADAATRAAAALALGHLGSRAPEAVTPWLGDLAALFGDADGFVRQQAVEGIALCGAVTVPTLDAILRESPSQPARVRAAAALRAMHTLAAAPVLFRILNDANHLVHTFAYEALDDLGLLDNLLLTK